MLKKTKQTEKIEMTYIDELTMKRKWDSKEKKRKKRSQHEEMMLLLMMSAHLMR